MLRRALRSMVTDQVKYSAPRLWPARLWSEPLRKLLTPLNVPIWAQLEQRWSSIVKISTVTRDVDKSTFRELGIQSHTAHHVGYAIVIVVSPTFVDRLIHLEVFSRKRPRIWRS